MLYQVVLLNTFLPHFYMTTFLYQSSSTVNKYRAQSQVKCTLKGNNEVQQQESITNNAICIDLKYTIQDVCLVKERKRNKLDKSKRDLREFLLIH